MKKILLLILVIIGLGGGLYVAGRNKAACPLKQSVSPRKDEPDKQISKAFGFLKARKDRDALLIFELVLVEHPDNLDALWGKAEVLRRDRKYNESEAILNKILQDEPTDASSLISLAYIRYKDDNLDAALNLVNRALENTGIDKENQALAYVMLGTINSRRSAKGWIFSKIRYGMQIKHYFLKARELSPDLPEVHLGLGTFYLMAPAIAGGNLNKALEELQLSVKIAPEFATANARLAQAYKKKGNPQKYDFYIRRTQELDPENEVLKEIKIRDGS